MDKKELDEKYSYQIDEHDVVHLFRGEDDCQEYLTNPLLSAIFKIETLEKENAELKELLKDKSCLDCNHLHSDLKLAKAKEHIRTLISCLIDWVQEGNKDELREKRNRTIESLNDIKAILGLDELYIDELEKELADAKKVQVVEHFEAYGQCRDSRRITELEQENADLKEQNRNLLESCEGATMMYKNLCKAKELLKMVLDW